MTVDDILAASRRLTLADQSYLVAALAQQLALTLAAAPSPAAPAPAPPAPDSWAQLMQLVEDYGVRTGIGDLAHQHDHYLYGTAPRGVDE
ncbi:MAG: hypothetical protein HC911_18210 [Chloroflexaceae bacterium]|nr:hypothetical protein [Chloroflexaceae bacterium]